MDSSCSRLVAAADVDYGRSLSILVRLGRRDLASCLRRCTLDCKRTPREQPWLPHCRISIRTGCRRDRPPLRGAHREGAVRPCGARGGSRRGAAHGVIHESKASHISAPGLNRCTCYKCSRGRRSAKRSLRDRGAAIAPRQDTQQSGAGEQGDDSDATEDDPSDGAWTETSD